MADPLTPLVQGITLVSYLAMGLTMAIVLVITVVGGIIAYKIIKHFRKK